MFKFIGAAAVLAAAYGINGAMEVTVLFLASFATLFYIMAFRLFSGLSRAELVDDVDILKMSTIYMIYLTSAVVVFNGEYSYVALIAAPWLIIQGFINILSVLLKLGIVGINKQ